MARHDLEFGFYLKLFPSSFLRQLLIFANKALSL